LFGVGFSLLKNHVSSEKVGFGYRRFDEEERVRTKLMVLEQRRETRFGGIEERKRRKERGRVNGVVGLLTSHVPLT
jgi:hypothetical protein